MMHGMTGTSEKMMPLARQLVPKGWNVLCPEAIIPHPTRGGFAWWLRSDDPTLPLNEKSLQQVHESVLRVITEIPELRKRHNLPEMLGVGLRTLTRK